MLHRSRLNKDINIKYHIVHELPTLRNNSLLTLFSLGYLISNNNVNNIYWISLKMFQNTVQYTVIYVYINVRTVQVEELELRLNKNFKTKSEHLKIHILQ